MKLGQIRHNNAPMAAIFENGQARVIRGHTALDVVKDPKLISKAYAPIDASPILPIHAPEVWGCGCTYETDRKSVV